jgi:trehalose/maltose transport system substrate-binding protein
MQLLKWAFVTIALWWIALCASAVEITISCGSDGQEQELCMQAAHAWEKDTGNKVHFSVPPQKTNERYFKYLIDLGDGDSSVDVFQIDVIWPGLLANYFVDLRDFIPEEAIQKHDPVILENNTVDGRLVGLPWFTDVGMLYYRKDLLAKYDLEVPKDWSTLADIALYIQSAERKDGNSELWGYVFQGAPYEGLTCNVLEWVNAYGGGTIVDAEGNVTIDNPQAALAIGRAADWVGTIAPPRVTFFDEERARQQFQLGNAVFMRNWPSAWSLLNASGSPVAGKVDVAPLPGGGVLGTSSSTLGGWQLAVSKLSKHQKEAADLVRYLTSEVVQKQRAITGSFAPTIMSLYDDPEVLQANPFFAKIRPALAHAVARPSAVTGDKYMAVTAHVWESAHDVLQGVETALDSVTALQGQLRLIKGREGW